MNIHTLCEVRNGNSCNRAVADDFCLAPCHPLCMSQYLYGTAAVQGTLNASFGQNNQRINNVIWLLLGQRLSISRMYSFFLFLWRHSQTCAQVDSLLSSRSHTIRQIYPVGPLWMSDQLVAKTATNTTHYKHNRWKFMPSAGFEPAIPAIQ